MSFIFIWISFLVVINRPGFPSLPMESKPHRVPNPAPQSIPKWKVLTGCLAQVKLPTWVVFSRAAVARHDLFKKVGTMRKKNFFYSVFAVVLSFAISGAAQAQAGNQPFLRGDSNADARIDLSDAIFSLRYLFPVSYTHLTLPTKA